MPARAVGPRPLADRQAVMNMPPMLGCGIDRIDAERFDDIDCLQDLLDLRPAGETQEALPAGTYEGNGRVTLPVPNGAQNIDARDDGAVVVGYPANESKDTGWRERDDAPLPIDDVLLCNSAEANPVLDALLDEGQLDMSESAIRLIQRGTGAAQPA